MAVRIGIPLSIGLLALGMAGCSSGVERHVRSDGSGVAGSPALMWQPEAEGSPTNPSLIRAREAVSARLGEQGFHFAEQAPVMLSVGVAERPARLVLQAPGDATVAGAGQPRSGLFSCRRPVLTRLSVSLTDSASGELLYKGSAEETHCRAASEELAGQLAASALADMKAPVGARIEISPRSK